MPKNRILLIEDEESIRNIIQFNLEMEEYEVIPTGNGLAGLTLFKKQRFDLIILDLMLPKVNGLDILKKIRIVDGNVPIIIVSAKDTSTDRIKGLKQGADDYLNKPFEIEELLLRIEKLLSRQNKIEEEIIDIYHFGNCSINFNKYTGTKGKESFDLSAKEINILKLLIKEKNKVVSRHDILRFVWSDDIYPSTRTIDNFIGSLRKHFEDEPKSPQYIKSVHGVGYKFVEKGK